MLPFKSILVYYCILLTAPCSGQLLYNYQADGMSFKTSVNLSPNTKKSAEDYILFYQKYISALRGSECPMFPSCSNYTLQEINKYGIVKGVISGTDRLLRCGHEHSIYPITLQTNGFKLLDPVYDSTIKSLEYHSKNRYFPINVTEKDSAQKLVALLISESMYKEALVEIYKIRIKNADSSVDLFANEFICFNALKEYDKLLYKFESLPISQKNTDYRLLKQVFISHYKLGNFQILKGIATDLVPAPPGQEMLEQDCKNIVFAAGLHSNDKASIKLQMSQENIRDPYNELKKITLNEVTKYKPKSSSMAGLMSAVLPGAGYAYAESYITAISALVFNGLMSYASYSSFQNGNKGMGILTGLFGMAFYIGNIQGSSRQVTRINESKLNKIINSFEYQTHIY